MLALSEDDSDLNVLPRLGFWAVAAVVSLVLAIVALRSDLGARRLTQATLPAQAAAKVSSQDIAALNMPREDTRRTIEVMRALTADQDRLAARVAVLERNLDDVTGSVGRISSTRSTASAPPLGPTALSTIALSLASPPQMLVASAEAGKDAAEHAPEKAAEIAPSATETTPAAESTATQTEFGVDLGGGINLRTLRDMWNNAKNNYGEELGGMTPVVGVRDTKGRAVQLRLIAGPLANAKVATRLCAALSASGQPCQPAVYDGQKLALP